MPHARSLSRSLLGAAVLVAATTLAGSPAGAAPEPTPAGITPEWGIASELAATPGGTLALASTSSGSWIYLNDTGADVWTTPVEEGDGGAGWNDLAFTGEDVGWVVYSPAAGYPGDGTLLTTADGGRTWTKVPVSGP